MSKRSDSNNRFIDASTERAWSLVTYAKHARMLVIVGWSLSMLGIASYCLAMMDISESVDPYSSLFQRGSVGLIAIPLLLTGVICWITGAIKLLSALSDIPSSGDCH